MMNFHPSRIADWAAESLKRKLTLVVAASLLFASLLFLTILVGSYRNRVLEERRFASLEINRLLQVGLENAMLTRDIAGLKRMVERLGRQDQVTDVMILSPDGEVRFASDPSNLGKRYDLNSGELCPNCRVTDGEHGTKSGFLMNSAERDVLRSINPVRNQPACQECHGPVKEKRINGILVVDYDAAEIHRDTQLATLVLSIAGLIVLAIAVAGIGWALNQFVLAPVARLTNAASAMSMGKLGQRVELAGRDEVASLGRAFNEMARRIEEGVQDVEARERYLQDLIDAMPDGLRVIDQNYRVVKANAAFCAQQGLTQHEIIGRPCHVSSHANDERCAATLLTCPLHEINKTGQGLTCRHRHVRADGSEFHAEVSAAPVELRRDGSSARYIVEVIRDLSSDIKVSQEERLSEIGYLAAGVAHEIHNPLASIRLGISSAKRSLDGGKISHAHKFLRIVDQQIGRCIDVTSRLLKLSVRPTGQPELVVLNDIVPEVLSLLNAEAIKLGVKLRSDFDGKLRVIGSDSELRMLVLNLAQNAIHAMPDGGKLDVRGYCVGDRISLEFEDTGVGISNEDLSRIYDPFWSRRADGVHGTGLGLSICREIIKHHGGSITVSSTVGKGTRFLVQLESADAKVMSA